jgi:hypothetical protein
MRPSSAMILSLRLLPRTTCYACNQGNETQLYDGKVEDGKGL